MGGCGGKAQYGYFFQMAGDSMLQTFFHWFYCLPIPAAVLLMTVLSAAYLRLRREVGESRLWQPAIALLLLVWLGVIAVATLMDRTSEAVHLGPQLLPFQSYGAVLAGGNKEILRSNFMNVVLFFPAGVFACELLPGRWSRAGKSVLIAVLFALASAGIEFCQYRYALGQAETDDVIHNALGALIGALVCTIHLKWQPGYPDHRR